MQMKFYAAIVNHSGFLLIIQQLGLIGMIVCPLNTYIYYNTKFLVNILFPFRKAMCAHGRHCEKYSQ